MSTQYHSLYWATLLTLRGPGGSIERLSRSLSTARVDLNPHQVDAALFAIRSLSKGVIFADEVGLGKTIEASLVIAQRWAERRRHRRSPWNVCYQQETDDRKRSSVPPEHATVLAEQLG